MGGNVSTASGALVWINSQSTMTVINNNYPSIVTSGLVMNLDAGFVSSYPKTGTTWRDLSGNGINGTLVNGPTFDSSNYGSIVFDGVDDVSTLPGSTFTSGSPQNGTFILKFKTPPFDNTTQLIFFNDGGAGSNNILFYRNAGWLTNLYGWIIYPSVGNQILIRTTYLPNQWYEIALTFDSQGNAKTYIDGVLSDSQTWGVGATSWKRSGTSTPKLISSSASGTGNIQRFMYYNRALTASEILQNYNAGLQRFIPTDGLVLSLDAQNTNLYAVSPTTAYDVSGNGNNGTLLNGTQYVSNGDGSWSFDGVDDYINVTNSESLTFGNTITVGGWYYNTSNTGYLPIIAKNGSDNTGWEISNSSGTLRCTLRPSIGNNNNITSGSLPLNTWNHCLFTCDNITIRLYLNGVQVGTFPVSSVTLNSSGNLNIGRRSDLNLNYGIGRINSVCVYNRALTQTEITTIYNATKSRYGL